MQTAVPDLVDLRGESKATQRLYGLDSPVREKAEYARQCLLARRLVERGVRFIELTCLPRSSDPGQIGNPWDQHGVLKAGHAEMAFQVDQPIAGLIHDLKARGLFDETLIVWAGEFGRTPFAQSNDGRDHNPFGFSVWLAGGGSVAARFMVPPMNSATTPCKMSARFMTYGRASSIFWGWITKS